MTTILIIAAIYFVLKVIIGLSARHKERRRQEEAARMRAEFRRTQAEAKATAQRQAMMEKEQARQAKEQEKQRKEQERQAAQLKKHDEMLLKLDNRLALAESEIIFNREQRERLFSLLQAEEAERDACIRESSAWQKHEKKVIGLENQIHAAQKRIDKAKAEKRYCESKMS